MKVRITPNLSPNSLKCFLAYVVILTSNYEYFFKFKVEVELALPGLLQRGYYFRFNFTCNMIIYVNFDYYLPGILNMLILMASVANV